MKKIVFFFIFVFINSISFSQSILFPTKKGTVLEYVTKDAKGKIKKHSRATIKNITGSIGNQIVSMEVQTLNANKKPEGNPAVFKIKILKDKIIFDPKTIFSGMSDASMEFTGEGNSIPTHLNIGQSLPDVQGTMSMNMGATKISTAVKIKERKVLAKEKITVIAGTYDCYKVQQLILITMSSGKTIKQKQFLWFTEGIGQVKSEIYENNQLISIEELKSIQ